MSESIWKKEIHLRKPKPAPLAAAPVAAPTSFWKKERHLRRQPEPLPPLPEKLLQQQRETATAPRGMVVVPVVPKPNPEKEWPSLAAPPVPEPPADEPVLETPELEQTLELPVVVSPWAPPVEEPEPQLDLAPSAEWVSDTPPEADAWPEKVPLLKRELHLRRPKREKAPKAKREKPEKTSSEEKVPLLKRELHLRRPKHDKAPKAKREKPEKTSYEEKVPLLKREIQFGRRRKTSASQDVSAHKISRVVGLRIGSTQLTAAHVHNNGSAELVQLASVPLERGVIVAGEVREPIALARALKAFFATNKLPKKGIRLGVASNRIGVRVLDVPAVDDPKQFENAIRFRAQEALPIPVADAVLDHVVLDEEASGEGETMRRVLLVFAHRELVSRYVDVCRQAGLRLAGIDFDAFALLRAVGPKPDREARRASVAVAVGHERTIFAVSDGEICDFTRVLEWGSNAIDVAIARALNLSPSQAEPLKLAFDVNASEPPAGLSPMQFEVARAAVTGEIGHLVRELLSSLRFYQSRPGSLDLHEVVLAGGGAELPGFADEVQRGLGVPVRLGDPFGRVSLAKRVKTPERAGSYAVAVGLGIEV